MNEIEMLVKWCERYGSKVIETEFFKSYWLKQGTSDQTGTIDIGSNEGIAQKDCFFFGHLDIGYYMSGTIVLTGINVFDLQTKAILKGRTLYGNNTRVGIGSGVDVMGNGQYIGNKRIYSKGFNHIAYATSGMGVATTWDLMVEVDGILFRMK